MIAFAGSLQSIISNSLLGTWTNDAYTLFFEFISLKPEVRGQVVVLKVTINDGEKDGCHLEFSKEGSCTIFTNSGEVFGIDAIFMDDKGVWKLYLSKKDTPQIRLERDF